MGGGAHKTPTHRFVSNDLALRPTTCIPAIPNAWMHLGGGRENSEKGAEKVTVKSTKTADIVDHKPIVFVVCHSAVVVEVRSVLDTMTGPSRRDRGVAHKQQRQSRRRDNVVQPTRSVGDPWEGPQQRRDTTRGRRKSSKVRSKSPPPKRSSKNRHRSLSPPLVVVPPMAAPAITTTTTSRKPAPSRPLLDELFGFTTGLGDSPFDEYLIDDDGPPRTIFAATHFTDLKQPCSDDQHEQASPISLSPNRRRSRREMGHFSTPPRQQTKSSSQLLILPSSEESSLGGEHNNHRTKRRSKSKTSSSRISRSSSKHSLQNSQYTTEDVVRGCVRGSFSVGRHVTQCIMSTVDIYHDECHNRHTINHNLSHVSSSRGGGGDESLLLPHDGTGVLTSNNSVEESGNDDEDDDYHDRSDEDDTYTGTLPSEGPVNGSNQVRKDSPLALPPSQQYHDRSTNPTTANDNISTNLLQRVMRRLDVGGGTVEEQELPKQRDLIPTRAPPSPTRSSSPNAIVALNGDVTNTPRAAGGANTTDLREVRINLFRQDMIDQNNDRVVGEAQYLQALHELQVQVEFARVMQSELDQVREELSKTKLELNTNRNESEQRHLASMASSEKILRDKSLIEEQLRSELKQTERLGLRINEIQIENNELKTALKNEKVKAAMQVVAKRTMATIAGERATAPEMLSNPSHDTISSSVAIALKANVVQLRAEVAEAHAARLSAEQKSTDLLETIHSKDVAIQGLKSMIADLEQQAHELRCATDKAMVDHKTDSQRLGEQVRDLQSKYDNAIQESDRLRTEKDQLSHELAVSQNECENLRENVQSLESELATVRQDLDARIQQEDSDASILREEIRLLNEKLIHANAMVLAQAAEHVKERRRYEDELTQTRQLVQQAQRRNTSVDSVKSKATEDHDSNRRGTSDFVTDDNNDDDKESLALSGSTTTVSHLMKFVNRNIAADVAEMLQRSKSLQSN